MYRSFLLSLPLSAMAASAGGQYTVHQVFALSEGYYDYFGGGGQLVPVTLAVYQPTTGTYTTVATLTGPRFGSDVLVHDGKVYVAADDRVVRFDADSYAQEAMAEVAGVRKLAVWNNLLLLTRGELGGLSHYFEARDLQTLELAWTIDPADGLTMSAEDVLVVGDLAYLAVNNAFDWSNLAGKVGVVDLPSQTYGPEVDLGPAGLNPERLFLRDGELLVFCNTDFSRSTVSRLSAGPVPAVAYTVEVASNSGCAMSALVEAVDRVYFLEYAQNELARFDPANAVVTDTLAGSPSIYGLVEDPINEVLYATTTDFFSSGAFHVLSFDGQVQYTVPAGISIGNLALDLRLSTGLAETAPATATVFLDPLADVLTLSGLEPGTTFRVLDAAGRMVVAPRTAEGPVVRMAVPQLKPGMYAVVLAEGSALRFVKH